MRYGFKSAAWLLGFALLAAACGTTPDLGELSIPPQPDSSTPAELEVDVPESNAPSSPRGRFVPRTAEIVDRYRGEPMALSPDGQRVITGDPDLGVCLYESGASDPAFCRNGGVDVDAGEQMVRPGDTLSWSADGTAVAFSPSVNADAAVLDAATGEARNINDDGLWDVLLENGNKVLHDSTPRWLVPNESIVFLQFGVDSPLSLVVLDVASESISNVIELPTETNGSGWQVSVIDLSSVPLVLDPDTVLLSGSGALFRATISTGVVDLVVDYSWSYQGEVPGISPVATVHPVAELPDGRLLTLDLAVTTSALGLALTSGTSSGLLVLDPETGELVPVFEVSPRIGGWLGPTQVWMSPDSEVLLVGWVDSTTIYEPLGYPYLTISVIDLATVALPVDPRDLPVLWAPSAVDSTTVRVGGEPVLQTWSAADTITVANQLGETLVLQLS